jgi:thioredoxin reductase (NADPH)
MEVALHDEAMMRGLIRYCPICDGYEVTDKTVGVIGTDEHGIKEAVFLRGFTPDLTLISPSGPHTLTHEQRAKAEALGIRLVDGRVMNWKIDGDKLAVPTSGGRLLFDSVYPALGSDVHSDLAKMVGAEIAEDDCVVVDDHQRTTVPGLYAAGDVVIGLDQISHARGEGGVAAVTIRNDLTRDRPLVRQHGRSRSSTSPPDLRRERRGRRRCSRSPAPPRAPGRGRARSHRTPVRSPADRPHRSSRR